MASTRPDPSFRREAARLVLPTVLLLALVAIALAMLVRFLVTTVDQQDEIRTRNKVASSLELQLQAFEALVHDNAYWNDMVRATYGPGKPEQFYEDTFDYVAAEGRLYNYVLVLDHAGRPVWGTSGQEQLSPAAMRALSPPEGSLRNRLGVARFSRSGYLIADGRLFLIAGDAIVPEAQSLEGIVPKAGPHSLYFLREMTPPVLAELGQLLFLDDIGLSPNRPLDRPAVPIVAEGGKPHAWVSWRPRDIGEEAPSDILPWAAGTLLASLLLGGLIIRSGWHHAAELARSASLDALSGLPNRRAIRASVGRRLLTGGSVTVAMLDLDGFKQVNDNHGHLTGDRLLLEVSRMLVGLVGDAGEVGRLGGDEFAIVIGGEDSEARLLRLGDAIVETLRAPIVLDDLILSLGASLGIATGTLGEVDTSELLRRADVAMYAAKAAGKGRWIAFDPLHDHERARSFQLAEELRATLGTSAYRVVYQPIVEAATRQIVGVEALLRWTSPSRGPVSPVEFIAVAEQSGLIDPIGLWVLEEAARETARWPDLFLSVNLSPVQLRNPLLGTRVAEVLAKTGLAPNRLVLEVTETALVTDAALAEGSLSELSALGVRIALDDFGTGYASLGFLKRFRFDELKIDRSLILDAVRHAGSRRILEATGAIAEALGIVIVAEGIEEESHARVAQMAGAIQLQGWLFDRALAAEELAERLAARQMAA